MVVYVVHRSDYDWTPVEGVFSSKEKAEEYLDKRYPNISKRERNNYDVDEWTIDETLI